MRLTFACISLILAFEGLSLGAQESPPAVVPIDPIVLRPNVWESTPQELEPDLKILRFEWISADQDVARSALPGLAFQKRSLNEAILSFRYGKLAEARLLVFQSRRFRRPAGKTSLKNCLPASPRISVHSRAASLRTVAGTLAVP